MLPAYGCRASNNTHVGSRHVHTAWRTRVQTIMAQSMPPEHQTKIKSDQPRQQAPKVKLLVKWGGAAITDKACVETARHELIRALAESWPQPYSGASQDTVLVHGAGSFGHHQAKQYAVSAGGLHKESVRMGASLTHGSVAKLNGLVVAALQAAGIPALGVSPITSGWTTDHGKVVQDGVAAVSSCLHAGMLPVLHGDVVFDKALGCTILSGDTVIAYLASHFKPELVIFLTNVAGVYDRDPSQPDAQQLRTIWVHANGEWHAEDAQHVEMATTAQHDVTGGIQKKVEEAVCVAKLGIPVVIMRAGDVQAWRAACSMSAEQLRQLPRDHWQGTVVLLASS